MIADGIENCVQAVRSYDINNPKKNPFWYFSKIAWMAFVRRIKRERDEQRVKHENIEKLFLDEKIEHIYSNELSNKVLED